jgi:hypothetical protein
MQLTVGEYEKTFQTAEGHASSAGNKENAHWFQRCKLSSKECPSTSTKTCASTERIFS